MNVSQSAAGIVLSAFGALLNRGSLIIYSGTKPTNPETALSGNTPLATYTFTATAAGAASFSGGNEQETDSFVSSSVNPTTGTAVWARATVWTWVAATTSIAVGDYCVNGTNLYQCIAITTGTTAGSGGPTGTGASITDSGVTWKYISAINDSTDSKHVAADYTVGTSGQDIIVGSTSFVNGTNVTLTFAHKLAAD